MTGNATRADNWKLAAPDVSIIAAAKTPITLPEEYSLTDSTLARKDNDLMIRSLDGVVIAVRGYFVTADPPKIVIPGKEPGVEEQARQGHFSIVDGDKEGELIINDPYENDADSYSITHCDNGNVIITLDSE